MHLIFQTLLLLSLTSSLIKCSKILGVFPSPGYSQFILCEKLMTELARRGHEVTVISAYKPREEVKNYRSILTDGLIKGAEGNLFLLEDSSIFSNIISFYELGHIFAEYVLSHEEVQKLIYSNETFDLVIVEQFVNEAHMGFSRHFKAPLIIFSSLGLSEWNSHLIGNTRLPSVEPSLLSPYTNRMTFFQRLDNSIINLLDTVYKHLFVFPRQQQLLTKYFPNQICLKEIMYNASLLLLNSHPTTTHPTTLTSAAVEIGGFHVAPKKLPHDIQNFLDEAKEGAIFFSMGSNLKTTDISNDTLNGILKVFSELKQRVLWKFDASDIPNKPKNLLISKWLPQSDILAHQHTVAFITHGGLLSTTEAIFHGVPMVGIPIFADQKMNVANSVQKGIALHLSFKELSEATLYDVIKEILDNPKYKKNAKKYSVVFRDQAIKPLDLATYWIEYVIRHSGTPHLKSSSLDLHWFQLYLVDIISFVILSVVIFYYSVKLVHAFIKNSSKAEPVELNRRKQKSN